MSAIVGSDTGNYDVRLGFWVNWSFGKIQGTTLTMTRDRGGILIAFLALYVGSSGESIWRVACFFLHRYFSSNQARDGLHHQRQCMLRNSDTAIHSVAGWVSMLKSWKRAPRVFVRIFPMLLFALIIFGGSTAAGLFSSKVTTNTANEVLLSGKKCGIMYRGTFTEEMADLYLKTATMNEEYVSQRFSAYTNYASQCYTGADASKSENCRPYIKPKLHYTATRNTSCPFDSSMCRLEAENLQIDTGYLDSHNDFGINSAPQHRFSFRMVSQCAPLVTANFSQVHQNTTAAHISSIRYYYGEALGLGPQNDVSYTYQVPFNMSPRAMDGYSIIQAPTPDYVVHSSANSEFSPIQQLLRPDGDTGLYFISAPGVVYTNKTDDPWLSAHSTVDGMKVYYGPSREPVPVYTRDESVGVIGCVQQYQFCNPHLPESSRCDTLGPNDPTYWQKSEQLWPNQDDQNLVRWAKNLIFASMGIGPDFVYSQIGQGALLVRSNFHSGMQNGLVPSNQWQLEMERLFSINLASLQGTFVDNVNGPSSPYYEPAFAKPNDTEWKYICQNQKIVSALYYSFNMLGICVILIIGGIFIILDFSLESIIDLVGARGQNSKATYARLEWSTNSTLQLQRLAHEPLSL